jgi:hypothetical protein
VACHAAEHDVERAALATLGAKKALADVDESLQGFLKDPDVQTFGYRRSMSTPSYVIAITLLCAGEAYMNLTALLAIGDDAMRWAAAGGLGLALALLAKGIGAGIKGRITREQTPQPVAMIAAEALAALALMTALAVAREAAFRAVLQEAYAQLGGASTGSATPGATRVLSPPIVPWVAYLVMQLAVLCAASLCSFWHANRFASEHARLERSSKAAKADLEACLNRDQAAADAFSDAETRWGIAFAAKLQEAEELAAWNAVHQHRYGEWNLRKQLGEMDPSLLEPVSLAEAAWVDAPTACERVGPTRFPRTRPIWPEPVTGTGNGRGPHGDQIAREFVRGPSDR